jgi:AcrR family transcriptional regulator
MGRAPLTRESVLRAALAIADAEGAEALSMRRLARELGVEAMSLYNHVANRADIERGLLELVWAEVDLATDASDWREGVRRICESAHEALLRHPWFFRLPLAQGGRTRLGVIEATLAQLERGGVPSAVAFHAQHVLDGHVYGYAWQALEFGPGAAVPSPGELPELLAGLPLLQEHARQHVEDRPEGDGFRFGLELILDGLERHRSTAG